MKRFWIFYFFVITGILFSSCKKEPVPVPSVANPVFSFTGNVAGSPVNIQAGVNDYYMYSSFIQDANHVYNFLGDLRKFNCTNCTNRISVQINDYKVSPLNAAAVIDTSLLPGYYAYQTHDTLSGSGYTVDFFSDPTGATPKTYLWNFGDGITSTQANPSHTYSVSGHYAACLSITFKDSLNSTSNICTEVKIGTADTVCSATFIDSTMGGNNYFFIANYIGPGVPSTYLWDFGDGTTSTSVSPVHTFSPSVVYQVCLKITDNQGYVSNVCRNIATQGFSGSIANFNFVPKGSTSNYLSTVKISWTDALGISYTSDYSPQPLSSYFQIVSVSEYSKNENNQKTKKLHVKFKCQVFNALNSAQIDGADAVISVAYR